MDRAQELEEGAVSRGLKSYFLPTEGFHTGRRREAHKTQEASKTCKAQEVMRCRPRVNKQEAAAGEEDGVSTGASDGQVESQECIFHELPLNFL